MTNESAITNNARPTTIGWLKFAGAIFLALALSYVTCGFVMLGYDWGYDFIDAVCGQPQGANQGVMAIASLRFLIFPVTFGLCLSLLKACLGGSRRWYLALAFVCLVSIPTLLAVIPDIIDSRNFVPLWKQSVDLIGTAVAITFAVLAFFAGNRLSKKVAGISNPLISISSSFVYLLPATLYIIMDWYGASIYEWNYKAEFCVYILLLLSTAAVAVYQSANGDKQSNLIICVMATLPILASNFLNIAGNIFFLLLDAAHIGPDLGWRALLSAFLICLAYFIAIFAGSYLGVFFARKKQRPADM